MKKHHFDITHPDAIKLQIFNTRLYWGMQWMGMVAKSKKEIIKFCTALLERVGDDTRCNNECKWMYFCDLKKGHKGKHKEDSGLTWD